jgi:hypothetical protein
MRISLLLFLIFIATHSSAQKHKPVPVFSFGLDYRQTPIDIEDVPRGPSLTSTFGELTDFDFWRVLSVHGRLGIKTKSNWLLSIVGYTRYNHNHYVEDPLMPSGPTVYVYNENTKDKERFKFDVFVDLEKKIRLKRNQDKFFTILAGLGLTNINSQVDIIYQKNNTGGTTIPTKYKGTYLQLGPKLSLGYQQKRIKSSLDAYFIEDPLKTDLTSLWLGATISYEMRLKKKNKK